MQTVFKLLVEFANFLIVTLTRNLPPWDKAKSIHVLPSIPILRLTLPVNIDYLPKSFAQNFKQSVAIPERRIFILRKVNVLGAGIIIKNIRIFVPSLSWMEDFKLIKQGSVFFKQWIQNIPEIKTEPIALAYNYWASVNYYHWMIDTLPRLLVLKELKPNCLIFVPGNLPGYIIHTTQVLGFNKLRPINKYDFCKVSELLFPELTAPVEFQDPALIIRIKELIQNKFYVKNLKPKKFIYVSRSRQSKRQIANEKALINILNKYKFENVFFEELTFEQQVNLMNNTLVIVSVHGANLTNILFMNQGSIVVELMNKNFNNSCYFSLASALSLPYYCIPCDLAKPVTDIDNYILNNNADLMVNEVEFEQTLIVVLKNINHLY